jgi:hypothetical protein
VVEEVDMKNAIERVAPFPGSSLVPTLALGAALTALMAGSWVAGAQPPPPPPGEPEEEAKEMIVMVRGTLGGTPTFGAGIIVGSRSDRLYIATANHVVRKGLNDAEDLRVEFRSLPGEAIEANLLEHADESLDLAVLNVPGLSERHISVEGLPFDLLGDPDGLERGDPVFHVGNPNGTRWRSNVTPDAVSLVVGTEIRFESYRVAPGSSGGGLFDQRWNLVGLVRADQPPDAVAIPIDIVLQRLEGWGYPVDLAPSPRTGEGEPGGPEEHEPADSRSSGCSLSGTVFDSVTNEPLPGVIIGFQTYTEDRRDEEQVEFNAATTGLDGEYRADCRGIDDSKFPLRVMLSHPNWKVTHVTHVKVERGMDRSDVNFPVAIRDSDLKFPPHRDTPPVEPGDVGSILRIDTSGGPRSHDFQRGGTGSGPSGGDFYFSDLRPSFLANNRGQRGIVDLGETDRPLDEVTPPASGYSKFGIPAVVGHVYAALARDGNRGDHIVFRVLDVETSETAVRSYKIQYYYRKAGMDGEPDRGDAKTALPRGKNSIYVLGVPGAEELILSLRAAGYPGSLYGPEGLPAVEYQFISVGSRVPLRMAQGVIAIARRALPNLRYLVITEDRPSVARAGGTIGGRDVRQEISIGVSNRVLTEFSSFRPMPESGFSRLMAAEDDATFTRVVRAYYSVYSVD